MQIQKSFKWTIPAASFAQRMPIGNLDDMTFSAI